MTQDQADDVEKALAYFESTDKHVRWSADIGTVLVHGDLLAEEVRRLRDQVKEAQDRAEHYERRFREALPEPVKRRRRAR